jgi:membrane protease YdiL (CAAX protease family)
LLARSLASRPLAEALIASLLVTVGVTLSSELLRDRWIASAVGFTFLGATWLLVLRRDDATVERAGVTFSGLVLPGPIDVGRIARDAAMSVGWALLLALIFFGPFILGFRAYAHWTWHADARALTKIHPAVALRDLVGQVAIIALPEEVFYRGYLQSRLDEVWLPRFRVFGAMLGPSLVVTSAIFALGHLATIHDPGRLAVFFPSLLFGWLRARTGGVGASIAFHALCNVFSATLLSVYGP